MQVSKFNADYLRLRMMLVRGQLNSHEAKLWLKEKERELAATLVQDFNNSISNWGRNANRDDRLFRESLDDDE